MKTTTLNLLTLLLILVASTTSALASNDDPPKRRQRFHTIEQSAADSTKRTSASIATPKTSKTTTNDNKTVELQAPVANNPAIKTVRPNTPQQRDSVLALWKASSTKEAYDRYFEGYLSASKRINKELNTSNVDSIYVARLEALMSPVPLEYNYEVREAIERFTNKNYASVMSLAYFYFPMFEEELTRAGLPIELRTLAVIESGLNPTAISSAGARGIWQFMPSTGKQYGLEINSLVDERCDPRLSTQAACRLFKQVYPMYNDWMLTLAAYNTGPGNVNKAIIRAGGDPKNYKGSFWDIYEYLPEETRKYVPFYIGATYAFAYQRVHEIDVKMPPMPLAVDTIMISRPMHLEQVSSTIDVSLDMLKMLNPQYLMLIIPATTKKYALTLPVENISDYLEHEKEIHAKDSLYLKEYVIHANLEKKRQELTPAQKPKSSTSSKPSVKYHTVAEGDNLGSIAIKYKVTVKDIVNWNNLENPNALSIGQKLKIYSGSTTSSSSTKSSTKSSAPTKKYHTVEEGNTLSAIAVKYNVTKKQLIEWNKLENPDALSIGQKLIVGYK